MTTMSLQEDLINKLGQEKYNKIQNAMIGIAGAGGLGSNCAQYLVRAGFKKFTIVDFDTVEPSNLDRQFYFADQIGMIKVEVLKANLLRINPVLELTMVNKKIERHDIAPLFGRCDAVAECLDRAETKCMIVEELMKMKIWTVTASGLGGFGNSDDIKTRKLKTNLVMVGDCASDICHKPALSPRVSIAAAKQADAILEYIVNRPSK